MKLGEWLRSEGVSPEAFGKRIGRHRVTIYRYLAGTRIPGSHDMRAISAATNGSVTANDFYDLPRSAPEIGQGEVAA